MPERRVYSVKRVQPTVYQLRKLEILEKRGYRWSPILSEQYNAVVWYKTIMPKQGDIPAVKDIWAFGVEDGTIMQNPKKVTINSRIEGINTATEGAD